MNLYFYEKKEKREQEKLESTGMTNSLMKLQTLHFREDLATVRASTHSAPCNRQPELIFLKPFSLIQVFKFLI